MAGWVRAVWQYGFVTGFACLATVFGVWFGVQIVATQREGIEAIHHIQDAEYAQAQQLAEMNQRLERTQESLRVTNDRISDLTEQIAALTRLLAQQAQQP